MNRLAAYEAGANAVVGLVVSTLVTYFAFPLFGWPVSPSKAFGVTLLFFVLSFARSYAIRRLFARIA